MVTPSCSRRFAGATRLDIIGRGVRLRVWEGRLNDPEGIRGCYRLQREGVGRSSECTRVARNLRTVRWLRPLFLQSDRWHYVLRMPWIRQGPSEAHAETSCGGENK